MGSLPIDKLTKLIPLLASDQDGEVVAAARAIGRALEKAECDFHDLVKALGQPTGLSSFLQEAETVRRRQAEADDIMRAMQEAMRANAGRARADRYGRYSPEHDSWESAKQDFEKSVRDHERAEAERRRDGEDVRKIKLNAERLLNSGKLYGGGESFVNNMFNRAKRYPDFVMSESQHAYWDGLVARCL